MSTARQEARPASAAAATGVPLEVAVLCAFSELTGPGRQLAATAAELRAHAVTTRIILLDRLGRSRPPFGDYLAATGIEFAVLPDRGPLDPALPGRARRLLEEWRPRILQSHGYKATAVAFLLSRTHDRPWIGFYHGATTESRRARIYHRLDRFLLARADRVVVMSAEQRRLFPDSAPVTLLHNAVTIQPAVSASDQTPDRAVPRIGVVGRLSPEKGVDVFLDACSRLAARPLPWQALIAGEGPERARLEEQARRLGIADRVRFLGHVDDVAALYRRLDLLVIPSRSEGLPNVLLEALAHGVRTVSTRVGAVPEVLTDEAAGLIVPIEDPARLAAAMERILTSPATGATAQACRRVLEPFALSARVEHHARLYRQLAGSSPSRPGAIG